MLLPSAVAYLNTFSVNRPQQTVVLIHLTDDDNCALYVVQIYVYLKTINPLYPNDHYIRHGYKYR